MEKNKEYFHPITNEILTNIELKSIKKSYEQSGSVSDFSDYIANEYFEAPSNLYPKLPRAITAKESKYEVLPFVNRKENSLKIKIVDTKESYSDSDSDASVHSESDTDLYLNSSDKFLNAKQSDHIPVLERNASIEAKQFKNIPVLERNANTVNENSDDDSDFDEEGIPYLKKSVNSKEQKWDDEAKEKLENELEADYKREQKQQSDSESDRESDQENIDNDSDNPDDEKPYVRGSNSNNYEAIRNNGKRMFHVDPHEKSLNSDTLIEIPILRRNEFDHAKQKTKSFVFVNNKLKPADDKTNDSDSESDSESESDNENASSYSNKKITTKESSKRSKENGVEIKHVDTKISSNLREDVPFLNRSRNTSHSHTQKNVDKKIASSSSSKETIDMSNIDSYINKFSSQDSKRQSMSSKKIKSSKDESKGEKLSWIERLNRDAKLEEKETKRSLKNRNSFSKTPVAIETKAVERKSAERKEIFSVTSKPEGKQIKTLLDTNKKEAEEIAAWFEKLYKESVVNRTKKDGSDKIPLWDRLINANPEETFPIPWNTVSAQLALPLEVFWQHLFADIKNVDEKRRVFKNALRFAQEMIRLNARVGNDDEISIFFSKVKSHSTSSWDSLRQEIYDQEYNKLRKAVYPEIPPRPTDEFRGTSSSITIPRMPSLFSNLSEKSNRFHECSIAMKIPNGVKKDYSWVYIKTLGLSKSTFFEKVQKIVGDTSMSKTNVKNLHHDVVLALKTPNVSTFGTNILVLIKFAFDSYNLLSNWISQGKESGVDFSLPNKLFEEEIYEMHVSNLKKRALYENL